MPFPHEEKWEHREGSTAFTWGDAENDIAVFYGVSIPSSIRARLASAAPEMARALLAVLEQVEYIPRSYTMMGAPRAQIEDACKKVRAALTKAGVPLP